MFYKLSLMVVAICCFSCGNEEQEQMVLQLQDDLNSANAAIDSLTYTLDDSNILLDALRSKADSAQHVNEKLINDVQGLNKSLREFRKIAEERKQQNERLRGEIRRMEVEKQVDKQTLANLRVETDSLNSVLLEAHTSIRRQSDHIRTLEVELAQAQDIVTTLQATRNSVLLLSAGESFLKENGFLDTSRPFGRGFRKQYKLAQRFSPENPAVLVVALDTEITLEGKLKAVCDRFGTLKKGDDYESSFAEGQTTVRFINPMVTGTDVLAILKE